MTIKTDENGTILSSTPGITTTDIPLTKKAREKWDDVFGKRCIKHPGEQVPCERCEGLEEHFRRARSE